MITRDAAHRYTDTETGITYPGVTGILDVLDKSFPLMTWAANQTADAFLELWKRDAVAAMMETVGEAGVKKAVTSRGNWKRDEAAQLGTEVHALADRLIRGETLPPMTDTQSARVKHYEKWWHQQLKDGAKLRLSEAMILRPNHEFPDSGFGGTFDLLYFDADGATVLADIKTGGKWGRKVYTSEVLQVTAYGMGEFVQPSTDDVITNPPKVYPMPTVDKYKVIHVTGEGCKAIPVDVTQSERVAFLACLDLYHWNESMKGTKLT